MSQRSDHLELTDAQRQYICTRAGVVGMSPQEFLNGLIPANDDRPPGAGGESALDAARRHGLVGAADDGPPDLATNPAHLEGLGRDGSAADAR